MLDFLVGRPLQEIFLILTLSIGALALAISVHEAAHAWMANRLGDPTARHQGRISLNPINHIDPVGTVLVPLILIISQTGMLFGWAKPTPFNPWNLKNPKRDSALISLAGPASNLLLATLLAIIFRFPLGTLVETVLLQLIVLNLVLAFFNLLPIPPLDGFKVVAGLLPRSLYYQWMGLERYGFLILIGFFLFAGPVFRTVVGFFVGIFLQILTGSSLSL